MTRYLRFASLAFCFCLTTLSGRTLADSIQVDGKQLGAFVTEHKGISSMHGHGVQEKRKRGGPSSEGSDANATGAGGPSSKKWGLAWPNGDASYLSNFARPKVRYLYTWSPYLPPSTSQLGLEGIPMLWGWNQVDDFQSMVVPGYATKVLGMNEPNEPSQSNMSPGDGILLWKQYIDPLKYQGYYLISPACTNDQAGLDWMQAFMQGCTDCQIDAIAFHFYGTDPQAFIQHATTLHDAYNKPIWITEFADQNFSGSGNQASMSDIYAFQSAVDDFVNNTPWVEAAFPFGVMYDLQGVNDGNSLLTADGWPTSLAYNYFG